MAGRVPEGLVADMMAARAARVTDGRRLERDRARLSPPMPRTRDERRAVSVNLPRGLWRALRVRSCELMADGAGRGEACPSAIATEALSRYLEMPLEDGAYVGHVRGQAVHTNLSLPLDVWRGLCLRVAEAKAAGMEPCTMAGMMVSALSQSPGLSWHGDS